MDASMGTEVAACASELVRHVAAFRLGDTASGQWLERFQTGQTEAAGSSWEICAHVLRSGPRQDGEGEFLEVFCAQTLAVHSRVLSRLPEKLHSPFRDRVEVLLAIHLPPAGRRPVWRQLALALTSADMWLASWKPQAIASAVNLPLAVRWEMLALPTELLFCDRALPLSDVDLWHANAAALFDACGTVFAQVFQEARVIGCSSSSAAFGEYPPLQVVASWLRAARMSFQWLSGRPRDEATPVRCLAAHAHELLALASCMPEDACEVAQQLARWRLCDADVAPLLRALLDCIFGASFARPRQDVLLPLLADLAYDRWPRAAVSDLDLDWQAIAQQAIALVRAAVGQMWTSRSDDLAEEESDSCEAALAVWQAFANTLRAGTQEWHDESDHGGPHAEWYMPLELVIQTSAPPQLFGLLVRELLDLLRVPPSPTALQLNVLWRVRASAQSTIAAWAMIVGDAPTWQEALWSPLRHVAKSFAAEASVAKEALLQEAEVVLWFSGTLAASWPEHAGAVPAAVAVYEFGAAFDAAPVLWRSLLWSSACMLASTAPPEHIHRSIEWMLQRDPYQAAGGAVELLELTELSYASAVSLACRQLPRDGTAHVAVAERIATLALAETPVSLLHEESSRARATLLGAMRHTMGGDVTSLCQGLSLRVLPALRSAAFAEAETATQAKDPRWHAAQTLVAALAAVLPSQAGIKANHSGALASEHRITDPAHPVVQLWREYWPCLEQALLPRWRPLSASDQPLATACERLAEAVVTVPVLLPEALRLLVQSAEQHALPEVQLRALGAIARQMPSPPLEPARAAEELLAAISGVTNALLRQARGVLSSPETVRALFHLLSMALGFGNQGICSGHVRPLLFRQYTLIGRCVNLLNEILPDCVSPGASAMMLRFALRLVSGDEAQQPAYRDGIVGLLPGLCASLCRALAAQEHLANLESSVDAGDILYRAADAFPTELPTALATGLRHVDVPEWARTQLQHHVESRAEWPKRWEWTTQLQTIVAEWQSERRKSFSQS